MTPEEYRTADNGYLGAFLTLAEALAAVTLAASSHD